MSRERVWESFKKELKYFDNFQTDLFVSSLASLASARQSQILTMVSKKFISSDRIEFEIFTHCNNCEMILNRMNATIKNIKIELESLNKSKPSIKKDDSLIVITEDSIDRLSGSILSNCELHLKSCWEAFKTMKEEPLLSESMAKSLLALIMHRPFVFENYSSHIPDLESLIKLFAI